MYVHPRPGTGRRIKVSNNIQGYSIGFDLTTFEYHKLEIITT
jgi:hypothetical protein